MNGCSSISVMVRVLRMFLIDDELVVFVMH